MHHIYLRRGQEAGQYAITFGQHISFICGIVKCVVASMKKTEVGALFTNNKDTATIRLVLHEWVILNRPT
jgi:hypothetical protein